MPTHRGTNVVIKVAGLRRSEPRTGDMRQMVDDLERHDAVKPGYYETLTALQTRFHELTRVPPKFLTNVDWHGARTGRYYWK